MTITPLPERTRGTGETESFMRIDDPAQLREITKETHAARHGAPVGNLLERVMDYIPLIHPSTEDRDKRLKDMNFPKLATAERGQRRIDLVAFAYTELTGDERTMWRKFLPTTYRTRDFAYDSIPEKALDLIQIAQSMECFDFIEVWTPEGNDLKARMKVHTDRAKDFVDDVIDWAGYYTSQAAAQPRLMLEYALDPMAVGVIEDFNGVRREFAIARWGEALDPVKKIKAHVAKIDRQEKALLIASVLAPIGIVASIVGGIIHAAKK